MTATFVIGDAFDVARSIPDGSVNLAIFSPPFLSLRAYLPDDHPEKHREVGQETTPAAFIDTMLAMTAEVRRVLAPTGTMCVELGDSYAGSGGAGGDYLPGGIKFGQPSFEGTGRKYAGYREDSVLPDAFKGGGRGGEGWPLPKSLVGIPHLYYLSLAYGRNLLTGQPSPAGMWMVRNVVAWCKPNVAPGFLGDKYRPATSYITVATLSKDRYFDLEAVREPGKGPPLDWWVIPPASFSGAHYAVYPPDLITKPIASMCPKWVCVRCGNPSRRIVENDEETAMENRERSGFAAKDGRGTGDFVGGFKVPIKITVGWTCCGCCGNPDGLRDHCHGDHWRPGVVWDPFGGSGTTGEVSVGHGLNCIMSDIDERNAAMAEARLGMFCEVATYADDGSHLPAWLVAPQTQVDAPSDVLPALEVPGS